MRLQLSKNFYQDEFTCRCSNSSCSGLILHPGFIEALQSVRDELDLPMHPTSGCRCFLYNQQIGGHERSLHVMDRSQHQGQLGTLATDFAATDGSYRGKLFTVAWKHGFSIGWNAKRGFLHLDRRDWLGLPQSSFDY